MYARLKDVPEVEALLTLVGNLNPAIGAVVRAKFAQLYQTFAREMGKSCEEISAAYRAEDALAGRICAPFMAEYNQAGYDDGWPAILKMLKALRKAQPLMHTVLPPESHRIFAEAADIPAESPKLRQALEAIRDHIRHILTEDGNSRDETKEEDDADSVFRDCIVELCRQSTLPLQDVQ